MDIVQNLLESHVQLIYQLLCVEKANGHKFSNGYKNILIIKGVELQGKMELNPLCDVHDYCHDDSCYTALQNIVHVPPTYCNKPVHTDPVIQHIYYLSYFYPI